MTVDSGAAKTTMLDPEDADNSKLVSHAQKRIIVVVGNAGGVEVGFNGKKLGVLGDEGKRKQVVYLPDGPATIAPAAKPADKSSAKPKEHAPAKSEE